MKKEFLTRDSPVFSPKHIPRDHSIKPIASSHGNYVIIKGYILAKGTK
jgi:hypothetical protein